MIKKITSCILLLIAFAFSALAQAAPQPPQTKLKVGDTAPEFVLTDTAGNTVKLSDYKGKKSVVLAFYVLAFTGG